MPRENAILDPESEDASNAQVVLDDEPNGIVLVSHDFETDSEYMGAESADTEGSVPVQTKPKDTVVTTVVRCSGEHMRTRVKELQRKVARLDKYQGTYKRVLSDGSYGVWDVHNASIRVPANWEFLHAESVEVTMRFLCAPYARQSPVAGSTHTETTLPCLIFTETGIAGDESALGELTISSPDADQWRVDFGVQVETYPGTATADTTAALFYEAESRLKYGGAAGTAVAGASGGTIVAGTVTTNYSALLSTASSGTAHCTHVGDYRVKARVYCPANVGTVSYALQWGVGDLRTFTTNDAALYDPTHAATFRYLDLGLVHIPDDAPLWEGRVIAKSTTAGDRVGVDDVYLFPTEAAYGEVSAVALNPAPTVYVARDEFQQSAGTITGKTLPVGGTWTGAGGTADWSLNTTDDTIERTAITDAVQGGRFELAGTSTPTDAIVQADVKATSGNQLGGIGQPALGAVARFTDTNNWVMAIARATSATSIRLFVQKRVAGTRTTLATSSAIQWSVNTYFTVRLHVDSGGRFFAWLYRADASPALLLSGSDSVLATGGTLASGNVGIYDEFSDNGVACTRTWDNFFAYAPVSDAAIFAGRSLVVRHGEAQREDSTGSFWQKVSRFEGDYLRFPPAGNEGRSLRVIAKAVRNDPATMADTAIDDLDGQLTVIPRVRQVPEP